MGEPTAGWMPGSPGPAPTTHPTNTCSNSALDMSSPKTKNSIVFSNKHPTQLFPELELGLKIPMFFLICMNKIHPHRHHTQGNWSLRQLNLPIHKPCINDSSLCDVSDRGSCLVQPLEMALNVGCTRESLRSFMKRPDPGDFLYLVPPKISKTWNHRCRKNLQSK